MADGATGESGTPDGPAESSPPADVQADVQSKDGPAKDAPPADAPKSAAPPADGKSAMDGAAD